jgi:hypothetical protein
VLGQTEAFSGETVEIELQITLNFDPIAVSGERNKLLSFITDPYYYQSNANNNFTLSCEYIAPAGNVNLVFPDTPCAALSNIDWYSGEVFTVIELLTVDLYQFWQGTSADADLTTYRLLNDIDAYTGETSSASILTSVIFSPIAYTGEYGVVTALTLPISAQLSADAYTGEAIETTVVVSISLPLDFYSSETLDTEVETQQYADYIASEGPSAYWKLDEPYGTSANDYTGNNTPATYTNGPVLGNESPVASRYAVYFDGTNDLIVGPPNVVSNNITQELWVKPDSGATITLYTPSNSGTHGATGQRYAVWPYQNGSGSGGGISVGSNGIQVVAQGTSYLPVLLSYQQPISTTSFTHILVSWSNRTPTLYVNGVAVATGYQARATFQSQGLPSSGQYGYYKGYMQDVAIYPTALTATQAREHYLAGLGLHYIPRFEPVTSYSGESIEPLDFAVDTHIVFGIIDFADGSRLSSDLQSNVNLYPTAYTGEILNLVDFILVPFIDLGSFTANSGENAEPNDLYTSVVFDWYHYSGENNLVTFTTHPSIDLGIVSHYASENLLLELLTSSIIDAPAYSGENNDVVFTTYPSSGLGIFQANSGERNNLDLSTFSLMYADARGGEAGIADLYINPFDELDSDARSGETGYVDIFAEYALEVIARSGETELLELDIHPSIPLSLSVYSGQYVDPLLLVTASVFSPVYYSGENNSVTFTTFQGEQLTLPFYSGGRSDLALATVNQLSGLAYSDQYSTVTLSVFYVNPLVPVAYSGQYSVATLRTRDALEPRIYTDQFSNASLTVSPAVPLSIISYSGSSGAVDILLGITFPSVAYTGERVLFDIDYVVNLGMPLPIYSGENAQVVDMATTYNLPLYGRSGELGLTDLGVEYAIEINGYSGTIGAADLTLNPPDTFVGIAYHGQEVLSILLSTTTRLPNIGYSGEELSADVTDSPAAPLLLINYVGCEAIASMQTAAQLPIGRSYTGTWANVTEMSNEPNWYLVTGAHCTATLSTSVSLAVTSYDGARGSLGIDAHPSQPLGMIYFRSGEWMSPGLEVLYSVNFRVLYRTSIMTQVDIRSATHFDLSTDECCGPRATTNNLNFIIEKGQYPEEVSYGNRVSMEINLRCNPRFSAVFGSGNTVELTDETDYFNVTFTTDSQLAISWDADLRHKLCKGYFIPTGDWVVVELFDVLPEDCYTDRMYGGERMTCEISDSPILRIEDNDTGSSFDIIVTFTTPWLLKAYYGESLEVDFPWEVVHTYRTGEVLSIRFYDQPTPMFAGSTLELEIQTEYGVRFTEDGCLDNEFVYQNDSGDAIPELFNPVPVEGEPYTHSVKAECF